MKRVIAILLSGCFMISYAQCAFADCAPTVSGDTSSNLLPTDNDAVFPFDVDAKSAVLMDMNTGTLLYAKNADEALPPASVTKIMTLLLIMEGIDEGKLSLDDTVTVSENAASMGGSQVFLEVGESMRVEELLKCVTVASANDAAVALAEKLSGSCEAFVAEMNSRAESLGMKNTHFENATGLDDGTTAHLTSAYDIALMSRELMRHSKIFDYTTIWTDSIRDGAFGLTNTNRLIRFYKGATGLKTGSTAKAGFCISATAERDGLHLIAVIMGSETRDKRNEAAKALLDYGFASYSVFRGEAGTVGEIKMLDSDVESIHGVYESAEFLVPKGSASSVETKFVYEEQLHAPVAEGERIGSVRYSLNGELLCECDIISDVTARPLTLKKYFLILFRAFLLK